MKVILNILLIFVMFQSSAQNLVPNSSFEDGPPVTTNEWMWADTTCNWTNPLGGPTFWVVTAYSPDRVVEGTTQTCGIDIDTAAFGDAYVIFGGEPDYYEAGKTTLSSPVLNGLQYYVSCYYKRETWSDSINFFPSQGCILFNNGDTIKTPITADLTSWHKFDTIYTPSSTATEIELFCMNDTVCGIKFDSIYIAQYNGGPNSVEEPKSGYDDKKLIKIIDLLGRETEDKPNTLLIYIFSNGSKEKVFRVE